jgi:hypothetical protein
MCPTARNCGRQGSSFGRLIRLTGIGDVVAIKVDKVLMRSKFLDAQRFQTEQARAYSIFNMVGAKLYFRRVSIKPFGSASRLRRFSGVIQTIFLFLSCCLNLSVTNLFSDFCAVY